MRLIIICAMGLFALFSAFFSAAQTALLSLSSMQVKSYKQSTDTTKQLIAKLVSSPRELLTILFMLDIFANILIQNLASTLFGEEAGWGLKVGVPLALTLIVGEIIPKSLAFAHKTKVAYFVAPSVAVITRVIGPFRSFLTTVTSYVSAVLFFFLKKEEEISEEELHHVLASSEARGILSKDEREFIDGYLSLQDATVKELMRPREDVLIYNIQEPISKLTHLFIEEACTRIPVCSGSFESLQGIMSAREFFVHRDIITTPQDLLPLLKKPFYVPETTIARQLLKQFAESRETLAIVISEYGTLSGLITREDLLETVVGEIVDRRDKLSNYTRYGTDVIIAGGKLELSEFEEIFGIHLHSPTNQVTLGGWLTEFIGDIPKLGVQIETHGCLFKVLVADAKRVKSIYVRKENRESHGT